MTILIDSTTQWQRQQRIAIILRCLSRVWQRSFQPGAIAIIRSSTGSDWQATILSYPWRRNETERYKVTVQWQNGKRGQMFTDYHRICHIDAGTLTTEQVQQVSDWHRAALRGQLKRHLYRNGYVPQQARVVAETNAYGCTGFTTVFEALPYEPDEIEPPVIPPRLEAALNWLQTERPHNITLNAVTAARQGSTMHYAYSFQRKTVHTHGLGNCAWERVQVQHYRLEVWQYRNGWRFFVLWDETGCGLKRLASRDTRDSVADIIASAFRRLETVR